MIRITDPRQQGSRLSWNNSLFEQVPMAEWVPPPTVPQPDVGEVPLEEFFLAMWRVQSS